MPIFFACANGYCAKVAEHILEAQQLKQALLPEIFVSFYINILFWASDGHEIFGHSVGAFCSWIVGGV